MKVSVTIARKSLCFASFFSFLFKILLIYCHFVCKLERQTEIFHLPFLFPNACNSPGWASLESGIWICILAGRDLSPHVLPARVCISEEQSHNPMCLN